MKNLFNNISQEEKQRILNLHESVNKKRYLSEQGLDYGQPTQPTQPEVGPQTLENSGAIIKQGSQGDPYVYAKLGNDYFYGKSSDGNSPNWVLASNPNAINSIKNKIYNENLPKINTFKAPVKNTAKVQPQKNTQKTQSGQNFDFNDPLRLKQLNQKNAFNTGGTQKTTENSFKNIQASPQVKRQLQYMKSNNILSNEKFTILDDKNSRVYEINPGYNVVKSFFVLTGRNKGDSLKTSTIQNWAIDNWRTVLSKIYNSKGEAAKDVENAYFAQNEWKIKNTPSGIFKRAGVIKNWLGDLIATNLAEETYGKRFITWETLDGNTIPFGFHGTEKPERLPVINGANPSQKISKRKMSFGCINFKENDVIEINKFIDAGQISVWLPDATDDIVQFPSSFSKKQNYQYAPVGKNDTSY